MHQHAAGDEVGVEVLDVPTARFDVYQLVILPAEDLLERLQRRLAGLDVVGQESLVKLGPLSLYRIRQKSRGLTHQFFAVVNIFTAKI